MSTQDAGMSALETLSPELQFLIIDNSTSQAVACLSEASKTLARITRRRRLHTIEITERGLGALQHWLGKERDGKSCQCEGAFLLCRLYKSSTTTGKMVFHFDRVDYRCTVMICRTCILRSSTALTVRS